MHVLISTKIVLTHLHYVYGCMHARLYISLYRGGANLAHAEDRACHQSPAPCTTATTAPSRTPALTWHRQSPLITFVTMDENTGQILFQKKGADPIEQQLKGFARYSSVYLSINVWLYIGLTSINAFVHYLRLINCLVSCDHEGAQLHSCVCMYVHSFKLHAHAHAMHPHLLLLRMLAPLACSVMFFSSPFFNNYGAVQRENK